jgi:hypothetical protein
VKTTPEDTAKGVYGADKNVLAGTISANINVTLSFRFASSAANEYWPHKLQEKQR